LRGGVEAKDSTSESYPDEDSVWYSVEDLEHCEPLVLDPEEQESDDEAVLRLLYDENRDAGIS